jgi:hypothetical protein
MSYNHPNQLTKPKGRTLALRRVTNFWPLLVWLGAIGVAYWAYNQGVVFRRLNGAVDVYQENVSPKEDGNFDRLAEGIFRGAHVKQDQIVAYMRHDELDEKINILKHEIDTRRTERVRNYDEDLLRIDSDLREIEGDLATSKAEQAACQLEIDTITKRVSTFAPNAAQADKEAMISQFAAEYRIKLAKSKALAEVRKIDKDEVKNERDRMKQERDALVAQTDVKMYAERNQAAQLAQLELRTQRLTLKAARGGIVDLILKEPGEYVKQGEGILKIVGQPTQIVGFLAQDQLQNIAEGKTVYITSTKDRKQIFKSKVNFMAPRMNSVRDVSTGAAASRLFGRDIICEYPKDSTLLPGQTVIIWLDPPGDVPWINKLLNNDDAAGGK